jgi:hypothetical protein
MTRKEKKLVSDILERRKLWERIYGDPSYIQRFFHPYDGELEALLELAKEYKVKK